MKAQTARDTSDCPPHGHDGLWTPDGVSRPKTPWWKVMLQFLLGGLAGFGIAKLALGALPSLPELGHPLLAFGVAVAGLVLGTWLQTLLHELGHALAGRMAGMRLLALGVGPWRAQRGIDGRWQRHRSRGMQGVGGFAAMTPPPGVRPSRCRESVFVLGGITMNLLVGGLAFALAASGWLPTWAAPPMALFGVVGLLMAAINLLPFRTLGWHSDGKVLLDLWRGHPEALAQHNVRQLVALTLAGVRPRDWPAALLVDPAHVADARLRMQAETLRLSWHSDRDEAGAAGEVARRIVREWPTQPDGLRQLLALAIAGHVARFEPDLALLRAWRERGEGVMVLQRATQLWLDAEIAMLADDHDAARTLIGEAREALPSASFELEALLLGEDLDRLQAALDAATPTPPPASAPSAEGDQHR
ncbi:MAG: M50 family metallopeptidase [Pseudoxanthomonas suwonensis]|nr:M50 family metallopeptidase [Pseudoxanthomonas suwonensis]